jgi:hypothetical protein
VSDKSLSKRINIKKVFIIIWLLYSLVWLVVLFSDAGNSLLSGNLIWDLFIVFGGLISGFPIVWFAVLCLSIIWSGFTFLKDWLFDK